MSGGAKVLMFSLGLFLPVVASAGEPVTIGVMEIVGKGGVPQHQADMLLDVLAEEISKIGDVRVIGKTDILEMLEMEKRRRLTGCTERECVAEIASALGTRWMIAGSLGKFGNVYLISLKLFDTENLLVVGRVTRRVRGEEEELLDEIPDAARELFDRVGARLGLHIRDRVTVASRHPQPITESPSTVIVITRKEIEESGATSVLDLLRRYPSLYIFMINPSNHMVYVRGSYRVLLLLDGREINMELFTPPFYETLPVGIHEIDRVEIVLGPNSALYGANAVSAVINIVTRKPAAKFHADLSLAAGENGNTVLDGLVEGGIGSWAFQGSGGVDRENSWMDRAQVVRNILRAHGKARLAFEDGALSFDGSLMGGDLLAFSDAIGKIPANDFTITHLKADFELGGLKARAYWDYFNLTIDPELNLRHPEMGISLGSIPTQHCDGNVAYLDGQYSLELLEDNLLIAGADFRYTKYLAEQLVNPEMKEVRTGLFLHDEHRFADRLLMTVGARVDFNTKTKTAVSPRVALVYKPATGHYLRLSGGTAFRKPVLLETGGKFKIAPAPGFEEDMRRLFEDIGISNSNLDNEMLTTVEIGYTGFLLDRALRLSANAYFANNRKPIVLKTDFVFNQLMQIDFNNTSFGYKNSPEKENVVGAGFSIDGDPTETLTLFLRGEYRRSWWSTLDEDHLRAAAGAVVRLPAGINASLSVLYAGAYTDYLLDPVSVLAPELHADVPARAYLMAHLSYRFEMGPARVDLGLSIFNPFGARFREKLGTTAPDNTNYGGEIMGPQAMVTSRIRY
jgi:outer membrane receptor protein involved in Fe transport